MMRWFLFLFFLSVSFFSRAGFQYPLLADCQANLIDSAKAEVCSQQAFDAFVKQQQMAVYRQLGSMFNEEIKVKLRVKRGGKIAVKKVESSYLKFIETDVKNWMKMLEGKVMPRGDNEEIELTIRFELPSQDELNIMEEAVMPTLELCADFNAVGQRSCLFQSLYAIEGSLQMRHIEGYTDLDLVFTNRGQYMGTRFKSPIRNTKKRVNDSLLVRFATLRNLRLVNKAPFSSKNYRLPFTYSFFHSEIDERLYFQEMAAEFLKAGDTARFIEELISAGLTFSKFSNFQEYLKQTCAANDLDGSRKFSYWGTTSNTLDSILEMNYYFNEGTARRLDIEFVPVAAADCYVPDSISECTDKFLSQVLYDKLMENYSVSLSDPRFDGNLNTYYNISSRMRMIWGLNFLDKRGFFVFKMHFLDNGDLHSVIPITQSHHPTYVRYSEAREQGASTEELSDILKTNITYRFIKILSEIPQLNPATVGDRPCQSSKYFVLRTGKYKR